MHRLGIMNRTRMALLLLTSVTSIPVLGAETAPPKNVVLTARASEIDPRCQAHPEIDFYIEKGGKPADTETASRSEQGPGRGQLVVWLMSYNSAHADLLNGFGLHYIQVSYPREWFSKLNTEPTNDSKHLGKIRLEATTGIDASPFINVPAPDSMQERAFQFVNHLTKKDPEGKWAQFLSSDRKALDWEKVIIAGASHGATSATRFALHQKVARVVMHCGPRDNLDDWQALPSATPKNRFFGYSHVLDGGWTGDHYERSWLLLGLNAFGPIVDAEKEKPPYQHTRRLTTSAPMKGTDKEQAARAHGYVTPSAGSPKDGNGNYLQLDVWRYLYTSPLDEVGKPVPPEPDVRMDQRKK